MAVSKKSSTKDLSMTFEEALAELEQIVQSMEDEIFTLEESLKAYERGVLLSKVCQEKLAVANQQVQVLQNNLLRPLSGDDGVSSRNTNNENSEMPF